MTSTGPLTRAGDDAGEDWSSLLLERDMTSTGRAGDWSRRLLEWDMTSTGRDCDGDPPGDWSSRFPEKDMTRPGRLASSDGDWSGRSPEAPALDAGDGAPSETGDAGPISRSAIPARNPKVSDPSANDRQEDSNRAGPIKGYEEAAGTFAGIGGHGGRRRAAYGRAGGMGRRE